MAPVVVMVDEPLLIVPNPDVIEPAFKAPTVVNVPPLLLAACAWFALANPVEEIVGVVRVRPARVADHAGMPDARCRTVLSAPLPSLDNWDEDEA